MMSTQDSVSVARSRSLHHTSCLFQQLKVHLAYVSDTGLPAKSFTTTGASLKLATLLERLEQKKSFEEGSDQGGKKRCNSYNPIPWGLADL